jgi:hypothetical protein
MLGLTEEGNDQVLVLYYAFYGHIEKMAQSVEEGACVSQLALEQRNEQGAWRLICRGLRWTKPTSFGNQLHVERRRSCACSKGRYVRHRCALGTGRLPRTTLAPGEDQRIREPVSFIA